MKIHDISIPLADKTAVWPGDPRVSIRQVSTIKSGDEANVSMMRMSVHTGTHIDAPKHFIDDGTTVDQIQLEKLIGEVLVIDLGKRVDVITQSVLEQHPECDTMKKVSRILFKTRNSDLWQTSPGQFHEDYIGLDAIGAEFLAGFRLDLIGVDYLSIARFAETQAPHQKLLEKDIVLLEGINLFGVAGGIYELICLPLKIPGCDGAPARAVLISK